MIAKLRFVLTEPNWIDLIANTFQNNPALSERSAAHYNGTEHAKEMVDSASFLDWNSYIEETRVKFCCF